MRARSLIKKTLYVDVIPRQDHKEAPGGQRTTTSLTRARMTPRTPLTEDTHFRPREGDSAPRGRRLAGWRVTLPVTAGRNASKEPETTSNRTSRPRQRPLSTPVTLGTILSAARDAIRLGAICGPLETLIGPTPRQRRGQTNDPHDPCPVDPTHFSEKPAN